MKAIFRILSAFCIGWFGYKAIVQAYSPYKIDMFPLFQFFPFLFLFVSIIITLIIDTHYFKRSRSLFQFSISFIGILLFGIVAFKFIRNDIFKRSQTLLLVSNFAGSNYVRDFEFKVNGRFRMIEYNRLRLTEYSGSYTFTDSTIVIKESNYPSRRFPTKGFIHNDTLHWDNFENMQIEKQVSQ